MEQFRQPRRFLELARRARAAGKFIVLLHPGRSKAAHESAATHTGALAGDYEVMHTLVTHAGVIHVESMEELVDVSQILVRCPELPSRRSGDLHRVRRVQSAGPGPVRAGGPQSFRLFHRLRSERCAKRCLRSFRPRIRWTLRRKGWWIPALYRRTLPAVLEEDGFGSVLLGIILTDPGTTAIKLPPILDAIRALRPRKPMIFAALDEGAPFDFAELDQLRELGVACFPSPERAIRALAHVTRLASQDGAECVPQEENRRVLDLPPGVLPEYKSKRLLADYGIAIPEGRLARSSEEAVRIARETGISGGVEGAGCRSAAQIRCGRRPARTGIGSSGCRGVVCAAEQYRALAAGTGAGWSAGGAHG